MELRELKLDRVTLFWTRWAYLELAEFAEVGHDEVLDAIHGAGQRDAADEEDEQEDVGRCGRHVHYFTRGLHACKTNMRHEHY